MTIIFIDTVKGYGGGQVILDKIVAQLEAKDIEFAFIRSQESFSSLLKTIQAGIRTSKFCGPKARLTLVANANKSLPLAVILRLFINLVGFRCRLLFIAHNYPSSKIRASATRLLTWFVTKTICVEPGLEKYFRKTVEAPLLTTDDAVQGKAQPLKDSPIVVSFQRADPVKGGFRLAEAYKVLSQEGYSCKVGLDKSIESNSRYESDLRIALRPWLEDGRRDKNWLERGDIFICSSLSEAAALSVQEALLRGCFVIATHIGALSYLQQFTPSLYLLPRWSEMEVLRAVATISSLNLIDREIQLKVSQEYIESIRGEWMHFAIDAILDRGR